jgi:hypothetical protein
MQFQAFIWGSKMPIRDVGRIELFQPQVLEMRSILDAGTALGCGGMTPSLVTDRIKKPRCR